MIASTKDLGVSILIQTFIFLLNIDRYQISLIVGWIDQRQPAPLCCDLTMGYQDFFVHLFSQLSIGGQISCQPNKSAIDYLRANIAPPAWLVLSCDLISEQKVCFHSFKDFSSLTHSPLSHSYIRHSIIKSRTHSLTRTSCKFERLFFEEIF